MPFCTKCGHQNSNDAWFCVECGAPLRQASQVPAGVAPTAAPPASVSPGDRATVTRGRFPIKALVLGAAVVAILAVGAGVAIYLLGPESVSEAVVSRAVQKFVDDTPAYADQRICLSNFSYDRDAVAVNPYDERTKRWLAILVEGGMYEGPEQQELGGFPPQAQLLYKKTEAGKKATKGRRLCFAEGLTVSKVENIRSPDKIGENSIVRTEVTFSFRNPTPWSQSPAFRETLRYLIPEPKQVFALALNKEGKWAVSTGLGQAQVQRQQPTQPSESSEPVASGGFFDKLKNLFAGFGEITKKQECPSTQIAGLQTLGSEDGKQMVLSLTMSDGSTVKYWIKLPTADTLATATKEGISKQKVSSWDMEQSGTALSIGESPLPLGVALKITVKQECPSAQIAGLQTMALEEGKETVLSLTMSDGSTVKYRIKSPTADALAAATKEGISKQKVSFLNIGQSGTALSIGESPLPLGVALRITVNPSVTRSR